MKRIKSIQELDYTTGTDSPNTKWLCDSLIIAIELLTEIEYEDRCYGGDSGAYETLLKISGANQ